MRCAVYFAKPIAAAEFQYLIFPKTMSSVKRVNITSLITVEELDQMRNIRVEELPKEIDLIGEGAFGEVFLFKFKDGSFRAGKRPRISICNKSIKEENTIKKHLQYALNEINILHQLNHERIIKFYGFYLDHRQIVIFMEAMEGSVKNEINEKEHLSEIEAMHFFAQAAEGLVYLHSRKPKAIIHRDIKCENLLLTADKNVKLADFGLAVDLAISSASLSVLSNAPTSFAGTYLFVAPEVIERMDEPQAYGRKSDVWSLACTLVQMISGKPPYGDLTYASFVLRSSSTSSDPLTYSGDLLLPTASDGIRHLLNSMFIIEKQLRPSAEAVLSLANDVTRTITHGGTIRVLTKEHEETNPLQSANTSSERIHRNGWQPKRQHATAYSDTTVPNLSRLVYDFQQQVTTAHGEHEKTRIRHDIPQNDEASKSLRIKAEQKNAYTLNKLGNDYYFGRGVLQSDEEAVKWYRKAAEQGNARGQFNLGFMYDEGRGVPQSEQEAINWYTKAAEQRDADAQHNLNLIRKRLK